jgi:hypothetical protein
VVDDETQGPSDQPALARVLTRGMTSHFFLNDPFSMIFKWYWGYGILRDTVASPGLKPNDWHHKHGSFALAQDRL